MANSAGVERAITCDIPYNLILYNNLVTKSFITTVAGTVCNLPIQVIYLV